MSTDVEIDGMDEFVNGPQQMPIVMGITPENTPRPAFTLRPLPPRTREKTYMRAQYDDTPDGKKLVGFRPETVQEKIEGGFLLVCMKGHSVAIDSLDQLRDMKLAGYVKMINPNDADGTAVAHVPVTAVVEQPRRKAA